MYPANLWDAPVAPPVFGVWDGGELFVVSVPPWLSVAVSFLHVALVLGLVRFLDSVRSAHYRQ